jgi:predicted nucleic acid-binding protein
MLTLDANIWIGAYDPQDRFHADSVEFLFVATREGQRFSGPAFVLLEVGCALARRAQNATAGESAMERLRAHPLLSLAPLNSTLMDAAARLGVRYLLRGGDAFYVATAQLHQSQLISWDGELIERAGAIAPIDWLAAKPSSA